MGKKGNLHHSIAANSEHFVHTSTHWDGWGGEAAAGVRDLVDGIPCPRASIIDGRS
jgi:hypothetical protein